MSPTVGILAAVLCCYAWLSPAAAAATCDKPFPEIFREISPAVVRVFAIAISPFSLIERVRLGVGSGVVIDDDGNVITNAHVIYEAGEIMISLDDNDMTPAEKVGVDLVSDVAVIRPKTPGLKLQKAKLGNPDDLSVGDEVLAVGYPFGIGKTATRGIISGMERVVPLTPMSWLTPLIQTDVALNPGNSGGPLLNRCGVVVGINTLASERGQNVNFAIPIKLVREIASQLIKEGRVIRPWHGINGRMVPPPLVYAFNLPPGLLVETIEPGSPAEAIGLHGGTFPVVIGVQEYLLGGDVITKVNGEALTNMGRIVELARALKVGDKISLEYWRDGQRLTAEIVLPERPTLAGDAQRFYERRRQD